MLDKELTTATGEKGSASESAMRPQVLILASDVLFSHFFPEQVKARLSEIADWSLYAVEEVARFFRGEQPQNIVTRAMLATMT